MLIDLIFMYNGLCYQGGGSNGNNDISDFAELNLILIAFFQALLVCKA